MGNIMPATTPTIPSPSGGFNPIFGIDPSGKVYEAVLSNEIEGATVTAYYKENANARAIKWDASEWDQENPLISTMYGDYAWDVPEGLWQVKVEKEGYETAYSDWMEVPPPRTEVNIGLITKAAPALEYVSANGTEVTLAFSQYMDVASVASGTTLMVNGSAIDAVATPLDEEAAQTGLSKAFVVTLSEPLKNTDVIDVTVSNAVSYNGKKLAKEIKTSPIPQVNEVIVPDAPIVATHTDAVIKCIAVPAGCSIGSEVTVTSSDEMILKASATTVDSDGTISIPIQAGIMGAAKLTIRIAGTQIEQTLLVTTGTETSGLEAGVDFAKSTVTFQANGGSEVDALTIVSGTCVAAPVSTREGYKLEGWYTDEECTKLFNFANPIERDVTLYAKWVEAGDEPVDQKIDLADCTVSLSKTSFKYTGSAIKPALTVAMANGTKLTAGTDYDVAYKDNINVGTATVTVAGKGNFVGSKKLSFTIAKAANPMTAKTKMLNVKASKLKKKTQAFDAAKAFVVKDAQGTLTYKVLKYDKKAKKKITVSKAGKVTVKKGLKKKTYKLQVKITAKGNANYSSLSKIVTLKVRVK